MSDVSPSAAAGPAAAAAAAAGRSGVRKIGLVLLAAGLALSVGAFFSDAGRLGFAYLWGYTMFWTVVVGGLFLVGLHHATHSVWSVVVRRVAEMLAASSLWLVVLVAPVILFAAWPEKFPVFPWSNPEVVHGDHLLEGKEAYLNVPFFAARAVGFTLIWALFAHVFVRGSLAQDGAAENGGNGGPETTLRLRKWAAPFLLVFALTTTFASFDWLMSLEPHWFSTIFGVYVFSGMAVTGLSAVTLAVLWLRKEGQLGQGLITREHLYCLGALIFAFTCFWAYIAFSQFMLIWYGNLPEETVYFLHRAKNGWLGLSVVLVFARFVLPFFLLLSQGAKSHPRRLAVTSVLCLGGQLLDLYWLIMPELHGDGPRLGWQDAGPPILFAGGLLWLSARFLARHRALATGDPLFEASRSYHW